MINSIKRPILLLLSLCLSSSVFAANKPVLNIQHWATKNGAQVYFVREPEIPIIDIQVVFAAGSAYDGDQWGVSSFMNSMLNEGTTAQSADQIANTLDSVGAQVGGGVGRDMAALSLRSLTQPKYLKPALKTFSALLTQSNFPEVAFQRVKKLTLVAIRRQQQNPQTIAFNAFYYSVYGNYPYAHPSIGTLKTVSALTQQDVAHFYSQYYVAKNAKVIIVGDVTRKQAEAMAQQVVGGLPEGAPAKTLVTAANNDQQAYQFIPFPAKQNTIVLGQLGISRDNPQYLPLVVGSHILGGSPLASILFEQVRNKRGLTYGVYSHFSPLRYRGPFYIALQTRSSVAQQALEVVQAVLNKFVQEGPTHKQLTAAKQNLVGSFPLRLSTNAAIMANVTNIVFYHRPLDYLDTYRDRVKAVRVSEVKKAFQATIHPNKMKVVVVGLKNGDTNDGSRTK